MYDREGNHLQEWRDGVLVGGTAFHSGGGDVGGSPYIIGDIEPYVSPIDGSTITGRRALRDHCKTHGVVLAEDLKGLPPAKNFDPESFQRDMKRDLKESLIRSYHQLENRRK